MMGSGPVDPECQPQFSRTVLLGGAAAAVDGTLKLSEVGPTVRVTPESGVTGGVRTEADSCHRRAGGVGIPSAPPGDLWI
jgi:hypothetical protein